RRRDRPPTRARHRLRAPAPRGRRSIVPAFHDGLSEPPNHPEENAFTTLDPSIPSTTDSGSPRESDAHSLSVGADGPLLLHDTALVEKRARCDRERVPERNPHAKRSGAFGELEI